MKLYGLIETIKKLCKSFPNVNGVYVGDVYELNKLQSVEYAAMVITEQAHLVNQDEGYAMYQVNVFYIDREVEDKGNVLDVHSHGISLLNRLVEELEEIGCIVQNNYRINTFEERFTSVCAGAYGTFDIRIPFEECEQLKIVTSVNGQTGDVFINTQGVTEEELNTRLSEYAKVTDVPSFLDIPTHTSQLTNDSGFLTETDLPIIPTKTSDLTNDSGFITRTDLPTKVSDLENNVGFITYDTLDGYYWSTLIPKFDEKADKTSLNSYALKSDIPTKVSQLENNSGYIDYDGFDYLWLSQISPAIERKVDKSELPKFEFDSATGTLNIITN